VVSAGPGTIGMRGISFLCCFESFRGGDFFEMYEVCKVKGWGGFNPDYSSMDCIHSSVEE